ncbi:hypothetical protein [Flavobacterium sp.]|uniref:hypothetical protein n=1 Tax=Flavobacterium sp. TaxID=239 RepID=UPI00374CC33D
MKKLVFTAIAMIAFSGASMANTKEVKKTLIRTPCDTLWIHYYQFALDELGAVSGSQGAWDFADAMAEANGC